MADLTVSTVSVIGHAIANVDVTVELTDAEHNRLYEHTIDGDLMIRRVQGVTDETGAVTLDIVPQSNVNRDNTYYTVRIDDAAVKLIEKGDGAETLEEAEVLDPTELGSAAASSVALNAESAARVSGDASTLAGAATDATTKANAARSAAETYGDSALAAHVVDADPHGDRAYAAQLRDDLLNGAPDQLNTIEKIADALGDDANLANVLTASISDNASAIAGHIANPTAAHQSTAVEHVDVVLDEGTTTDANMLKTIAQVVISQFLSRGSYFTHSYGRLGTTQTRYLFHRRLNSQLRAVSEDRCHSGAELTTIGSQTGGFADALQMDEPPPRAYTSARFPSRIGFAVMVQFINDIQGLATDLVWPVLLPCLIHLTRAVISWKIASGWWQHDETSTGQTEGGAGWSTATYLTGLQYGPGTSYRKTSSTGATRQVATTAAMAGQVVALCFIANNEIGTAPASVIDVKLDGVTYATLDTRAVVPASVTLFAVATNGVAVVRVQLPDDASTHTILATAGAGGMSYCGYWVEQSRPFLLANCAKRVGSSYTPNGSDAIVDELNDELVMLVAEFDGLVRLVDIDSALAANAAYFFEGATGLHPNDTGQLLMYLAMLDELHAAATVAVLTAQKRGLI